MKLLFDQNLSHKLPAMLANEFPSSAHVRDFNMQLADDSDVWQFAAHNDFIITSKDDDFRQLILVRGHPPKVIWLKLGNCPTTDIRDALRRHAPEIRRLDADSTASLLLISSSGVMLLVHPSKPGAP